MTVAVSGGADDIGLEDVTAADMSVPRIKIVHSEGVFEDTLTKERMETLDCVLLGLVKQRIMWHENVDEGDLPQCKSPDFAHGFPLLASDKQPKDKLFPIAQSNFNLADYPPSDGLNGLTTLPCAECVFKEWNKGDWKVPPCSEQHTYPLLYTTDDGESWNPALLTLQKSGIKPSRQYVGGFASQRKAMFTVRTRISLTTSKRGAVVYSTPTLAKGAQTDPDMWDEYSTMYRHVRDVIRSAPRPPEDYEPADEIETAGTRNEARPPEEKAAATKPPSRPPAAAKAATPEPAPVQDESSSASDDDNDMPF